MYLTIHLFDESRSISDFGYSEIELVISTILKRLWKDDPQQISQDFFHRIETPSWRKMKLVESLLLTMKSNNSSDFSLDKQTHLLCLQSFYKTSLLQVLFILPLISVVSSMDCFCFPKSWRDFY